MTRSLKIGISMFLSVFVLSAVLLYGGARLVHVDEVASAEDELPTGGPVSATVVAKNLQFDKRTIVASPGATVTVTFDNEDLGVLHNIAFYGSRNYTSPLKIGGIITGPASETITFTAPDSLGNFPYRCDVHPDTMTGTLSLK